MHNQRIDTYFQWPRTAIEKWSFVRSLNKEKPCCGRYAVLVALQIMRLDRTRLVIENLHQGAEDSDKQYWKRSSPLERLRAVQIDRQVAYGHANASRRLQRILEIADRG